MEYFNYHASVKKMIADGKLRGWFFCKSYHKISPALVLLFDDIKHPVMPIREYRWHEYEALLPADKQLTEELYKNRKQY